MKIEFRTLAIVAYIFIVFSNMAPGQSSTDLQWATNLVNNSEPKTIGERIKIVEQIVSRLDRPGSANDDIKMLVRTLELELDLIRLDDEPLAKSTDLAMNAPTRADRARELQRLRIDLLVRASSLMQPLGRSKMSASDAQRLSEIVRYASIALDDIKDPSILGGKASEYTRLLTRLNGIAKLAQAVEDPQSRAILGGLRNTLGTMEKRLSDLGISGPNPMKSFDVPAEVAGAIIDTSRRGMDESAAALDDVGRAIAGDQEALKRLPEHARKIESTLSQKTYGQAMFRAMSDRVVDRIPFARTLAKLIAPTPSATSSVNSTRELNDGWDTSTSREVYTEELIILCGPNPNKKFYVGIDGTDRYVRGGNACAAAVHAGVITFEKGGRFRLRFFPYDETFQPRASTRNGVTSGDYGWHSLKKESFVVLRVD